MPEKTQKRMNIDSYANMPYSPSKSKEKMRKYEVGKGHKNVWMQDFKEINLKKKQQTMLPKLLE